MGAPSSDEILLFASTCSLAWPLTLVKLPDTIPIFSVDAVIIRPIPRQHADPQPQNDGKALFLSLSTGSLR
jgi:hypothetical protein